MSCLKIIWREYGLDHKHLALNILYLIRRSGRMVVQIFCITFYPFSLLSHIFFCNLSQLFHNFRVNGTPHGYPSCQAMLQQRWLSLSSHLVHSSGVIFLNMRPCCYLLGLIIRSLLSQQICRIVYNWIDRKIDPE